jgi:hypothetical protein
MKDSPTATRPAALSAASLRICTAETPADWQIAHRMLDEEHLLGAGREAGDRLCQFILEEGEIVAVLIGCAAAWHLQDRDTLIGWDPVTRSQRLKLVVQLRRFIVVGKTRKPNLASQCLGLALRELPARWLAEHGYRPLMAESFSDPESLRLRPPAVPLRDTSRSLLSISLRSIPPIRSTTKKPPYASSSKKAATTSSPPKATPPIVSKRSNKLWRVSLFDLSSDSKNNHGRIDKRCAAVKALSPVDAGLLSAHSAIKVRREWVEKASPEDEHQHTRSFQRRPEPRTDAQRSVGDHSVR